MKKRCVIVGGAGIGDYAAMRAMLREDDFAVYCDGGLRHLQGLGAVPGLIVGDFDSHEVPHLEAEILVLPREKDDTDTRWAVKEALRRGYGEFLLLGTVGGRLDHTLGNVSILLWLDSLGKRGLMADDYSEMEIVSRRPAYIDGRFPFFSLLNVSGQAEGVSIRGAKYPLEDAVIPCEYQYGISNEVLPGETTEVSVREGRLLLVRVRRDA